MAKTRTGTTAGGKIDDTTGGAVSAPTGLPGLDDFLDELRQAGRSLHTLRAYAGDLKMHTADLSVPALRAYFAGLEGLSAPTRARKQASLPPTAAGPSATNSSPATPWSAWSVSA